MQFGVIYPHQALPHSATAIGDFTDAVEEAGLDYLVAFDHVLGADTSTRPGWTGPYGLEHDFHEDFVLFGFLAARTTLELVTGVMVLPQRQTALVAKQAADLDLLLEGRLRLGFAVGWNPVEFEALGVPFASRGHLLEEQIEVLRLFWTEESVTFEGEFHHIDRAGITPLPLQRPIPIWLGGGRSRHPVPLVEDSERLGRIGRLADGWMAPGHAMEGLEASWAVVGDAAEAAGRDRSSLGLQLMVPAPTSATLDQFLHDLEVWRSIGATHVSIRTAGGSRDLQENYESLAVVAECVKRAGL